MGFFEDLKSDASFFGGFKLTLQHMTRHA